MDHSGDKRNETIQNASVGLFISCVVTHVSGHLHGDGPARRYNHGFGLAATLAGMEFEFDYAPGAITFGRGWTTELAAVVADAGGERLLGRSSDSRPRGRR